MVLAIEARLAGIVAGLDLDQPDVQPGVAVGVESQRPGDWIERIAASVFVSNVTTCDVLIWTLAPPAGTFPPSHVAGSDHRPEATDRQKRGPLVRTGRTWKQHREQKHAAVEMRNQSQMFLASSVE